MEVFKYTVLGILVLITVAAVIFLLVLPIYRDRQKSSGRTLPYLLRKTFFSSSEELFFSALQEAVAGRWWIFPKVRLEDILEAQQDLDRLAYQGARRRIRARHVDFLMCDPGTYRFVAVIELDEPQQHFPDRMEKEVLVDAIFSKSGLPVLHFPEKSTYDVAELKADLWQRLKVQ